MGLGVGAPGSQSPRFPRMEEKGSREGSWEGGVRGGVLKDESLHPFLNLTCLFLFLPQMNWVSITAQGRREAEEAGCSQRGVWPALLGRGGHSVTSGTAGGFQQSHVPKR